MCPKVVTHPAAKLNCRKINWLLTSSLTLTLSPMGTRVVAGVTHCDARWRKNLSYLANQARCNSIIDMSNSFSHTCREQADNHWPRGKKDHANQAQSNHHRPPPVRVRTQFIPHFKPPVWHPSHTLLWLLSLEWGHGGVICDRLLMPAEVSCQKKTHTSCGSVEELLIPTVVISHNFTWLHKAGAKNSLTYFTALFTPDRYEEREQEEMDEGGEKDTGHKKQERTRSLLG